MNKRNDSHARQPARQKARSNSRVKQSHKRQGRGFIKFGPKKKVAEHDLIDRPLGDGEDSRNRTGLPRSGILRHPRTELESAIQRYAELFQFAPIGYVTFDRTGRIEEINLTAARLVERKPERLIGITFAICVDSADAKLFLQHLRGCRSSTKHVQTELRLKTPAGRTFPVMLSSTPLASSMKDGALFYQTAIVDLTERERGQQKLRRSEERYRTLFDLVPVAVYACDANGVIQEYNRRAVELWGQAPGKNGSAPKFCGSCQQYYPNERRMSPNQYPVARALRGEKLTPGDRELIIEGVNGERRHVISAPSVLRDSQGRITGAINCLYDVTEQNRAETAARRLAAIVQSSHDAIVAKDLNGIITDWNESAQRIFGYEPLEIIGKSILVLIPPERHSEEKLILDQIRRGKSIDHFETVRLRKDGSRITVSLTISPIKNRDGQIVGVSKIARDITTQKESEERLAEQARLLDLSNDAIIVRDSADRILYWNKGAEKTYGYTREEAAGKVTHELLRIEYLEPRQDILKAFYRDGKWQGEATHYRRDGTSIVMFSRWSLDADAKGKPTSILETNTDLTARKRSEEALAEAARRQAVLYEFVQRRSDARSLQAICDAGLDSIIDLLRCHRTAVLLRDDAQVTRFVAWRGLSGRYRKAVEGHSPWKTHEPNPQPIYISDVDIARLPKKLKVAIQKEDIRSLCFIPLVAREKLIGKFVVYYDWPHLFTEEERALTLTVGRQLAHGIDRKRAEEALYESEQVTRATIEQATVGIARSDRQGRLLFVNKRFCEMLGNAESELIGQPLARFTYKYDRARTAGLFNRLMKEGKPYELEKRYLRKDQSLIWVNVSASPVRDVHGKVQSAVAAVVDVTERKRAQAELLHSKEILETLVHRRTKALRVANAELKTEIERRKGLESEILTVSDREQQRLGQELHDSVCQDLGAIGLMAHSTALRLKKHRVVQVEDLEKIAQLINNSVVEVRDIARDLHKEKMDAAHFVEALHYLVERKIWSIPCRLRMRAQFAIESDIVASELYRILREALMNVTKHARATGVVLEVRQNKNELVFSVIDNGIGLLTKDKHASGLGFHIMNYRAKSIGGRLEVKSPENGGTRVTVHLPKGAYTTPASA